MRRNNITIWLILGTALLVALNLPDAWSNRGKSAIREFLAPLQLLVTQGTLRGQQWLAVVRGFGEMAVENRSMAAELTRLRSEMRYLEALELENSALREQLAFSRRPERDLIAAEVIGRDMSGWWQTVRIGKGFVDGVDLRKAVVTPDGLVGETMEVSAGTADVRLISDSASKVSAWLPGAKAHGIVSGRGVSFRGEPLLEMSFINKDQPIAEGEEILTSGLGGTYPRGLLIGHIQRVVMDEGGLYQRAEVVPAADIGRLTFCFVVGEDVDSVEDVLRVREGGGY